MKKIIVLFFAATAWTAAWSQRVSDSAWRADVKTVTLTREGVELEAPVLTMGGGERMLLQFDVLADEGENLHYTLAHCDAQWVRDDLEPYEFMSGFERGEIENIEFSFTTSRPFVHYHQTVPARYAEFTYSGNYVLTVVSDERGDTLLTRRFWVSEQGAKVSAEISRPYDGMSIRERQEVDVKVEGTALRPEWTRVRVQQNGRQDNARWLRFHGYDRMAMNYSLEQENIFAGGNTFRFFDCSNIHLPMYNVMRVEEYGGEYFAMIRPEEDRSRKHFLSEKTLNGGMKVNVWDRTNKALEADYVWVNLSLPMEQPMLDRSVYVVGQLTDWKLDSTSRMEYRPEYKAYVKRLLLKQGYYSYLLLCVGRQQEGSATERLEGDHMETPNEYTVYVYYRAPSDRADRLLAVKRVVNN
ncbi:MAG: DUF5103 domain-containing protein [Bacteroidales bacterium]|nr:DUF5103 domain-containing protein [Bacteroidales bacterium]